MIIVNWRGRLIQFYRVKYINGITSVVASAVSRTPMSWPTCVATGFVCDDFRGLLTVHSSCALESHAATVLLKLSIGIHVQHYSVRDYLLWIQTKCRSRQNYYPP